MAEGILRDHLERLGINARIDSCGTSDWHEGEAPDKRAIAACDKYGINIADQRSRPITPTDFDVFDLIFAMDQSNLSDIQALAQNEGQKDKMQLYLEFAGTSSRLAVPDPYYGDLSNFFEVYDLLDKASAAAAQKIKKVIKEA